MYWHMEGKGPFRKAPAPPPGSTPPQTKGTSPIGSAITGGCPPNLSSDQCAKFLSDRMALEETKAWADVANTGIKTTGGLLSGFLPKSGATK